MKKLSLFLSAMLISLMSFAGTVTFEIGQDKVEGHKQGTAAVLTKDGVTLDVSKGAFGRDDNFRIYAGFGVTISCEYGNITGVEITCTTEQYAPSNLTTTVGTFTCDGLVGTWTGDEASVAFSATKQVRFTKLVVTYESADANFVDQPMITGDVNFADTANVVITADEGMKIYYTLDGTDPTTASTEYTAPFEVYATTTVKAIAYNEATAASSMISETVFTQATKVPCAEAAAIAKALSDNVETTELYYNVKGYVTSLKDTFNTSYSKQQFWIADTKTGGEVLYAYNNQVPCAMEVGMKVRIVGKLKQWNTGQYIQPQIVNAEITVLAPAPKVYTVSATAENGTVEGAGQYEEGTQATLTATAAEGYEFVNWTVGDSIVSTENPYTFAVTADLALVANFNKKAEPEHTYTVAGSSEAAFGTAWDPANADNDMKKQEDGTYKWEKEGLELLAGEVAFKVTEDHAWTVAYPAQDYKLNIAETGIYTLTITFNPADKAVAATATKTGDVVIIPTIAMHGNFLGEWKDTENFTLAADEATATLTLTIAEGNYEFGMRIGGSGNWTSNGVAFTRENASAEIVAGAGNLTLAADVAGEYTFTWTFETNTLTVTYPVLLVKYNVTVTADSTMGTVAGAGEYEEGAEATLTATANEGYEFVNWTVEGTEVSTENPYKFNVTADVEVVANFKEVDPTTGVENTIMAEQPVKIVRNGQVFILKGNKIFNVIGQQVK